jgi:putative protease
VPQVNKGKPQLLAPAGDFEKLQMAIAYGADAVYMGGEQFSLRANAKNFDEAGLRDAVKYAHNSNVKVYVCVNIYPRNEELAGIEKYLRTLKEIGADAVIIADPGVFDVAVKIGGLNIHISTQANVTNSAGAEFYKNLGAKRVILARELSLAEISEITGSGVETEVFVHGAMCVSYSGRCLLSGLLTGRDANRGGCAQSCRWNYSLVEEKRPGEYLPVYEDKHGTYIFNSKDLCMVEYIPEIIASGVSSLKIEGRAKSAYYTAAVTRIYRMALDDCFNSKELYESKKGYYLDELKKTGTRDFTAGFYFGKPSEAQSTAQNSHPVSQDFLGVVTGYDAESGQAAIEQRNRFSIGDEVEFLSGFSQTITEIYDTDGNPADSAPHPKQLLYIKTEKPVAQFDIMRGIRKR